MLQEQFVTKEIAYTLKRMGFSEKCFGYYSAMADRVSLQVGCSNPGFVKQSEGIAHGKSIRMRARIAAPLWQQAQDFLNCKLYSNEITDHLVDTREIIILQLIDYVTEHERNRNTEDTTRNY